MVGIDFTGQAVQRKRGQCGIGRRYCSIETFFFGDKKAQLTTMGAFATYVERGCVDYLKLVFVNQAPRVANNFRIFVATFNLNAAEALAAHSQWPIASSATAKIATATTIRPRTT